MKSNAVIFLLVSNCYQTTQIFSPAPGSHLQDLESLRTGVLAVNKIAGCELMRIDTGARTNLVFSTDRDCYNQLNADGADGETVLSTLGSPRICVTSFWAHPRVVQWGGLLNDAQTESPTYSGAAVVVTLHEIGHAEGILWHSRIPGDIMYADTVTSGQYLYNDDSLRRYVQTLLSTGAQCLAPLP